MSGEEQVPGSMQDQHAAAAAPSLQVIDEPVLEGEDDENVGIEAKVQDPAYISAVNAALIVNLNLTSRDIFSGTKNFKSIESPVGNINLYNPFKREDLTKDINSGEGAARAAVNKAFELVDELNIKPVSVLGTADQIDDHLEQILLKMLVEVEDALPFACNEQVATVALVEPNEDEPMELPVLMRDIVRVSGWINCDNVATATFRHYTMLLNLTISAGQFYDHSDPQKYVSFVQNVLQRIKKQAESETKILLCITMPPADLKNLAILDLLSVNADQENDNYGFEIRGRSELQVNGGNTHWAPQSKAQVDSDLLTAGGDILLVKAI